MPSWHQSVSVHLAAQQPAHCPCLQRRTLTDALQICFVLVAQTFPESCCLLLHAGACCSCNMKWQAKCTAAHTRITLPQARRVLCYCLMATASACLPRQHGELAERA